ATGRLPDPPDEPERLASLKQLCILDTPAEERFDRITRLARRSLSAPISLISLVDADRQWFKSAQGLAEQETPREISFCGHAILQTDAFVVSDASCDERFEHSELVTGPIGARFYAGQPIHSPEGHLIGTLCIMDTQPRSLSSHDRLLLKDLALLVENEFRLDALSESELELRHQLDEAERRASIDSLTRLWNRDTILKLLEAERARAERYDQHLAVAFVDVDHFKKVNDQLGHPVGDEVLAATAERLRGALRPFDSVGRYGGEEFLIVLSDAGPSDAREVAERVRQRVALAPISTSRGDVPITVSVGVSSQNPGTSVQTLLATADDALYQAKGEGRNRVCVA
ncbi:MAG: sensor domain-containing diguanylate cyclase, partial [Myxococcota bacterium]